MEARKLEFHTIDYILALPDGERAELIDGQIYYLATPSRLHQEILNFLLTKINNYINSKNGPCKVYPAPFAVFLNQDEYNFFEPDISVICDPEKLDDRGCNGAPDWIIEIISPSTASRDYVLKSAKYLEAGVKEYWIIDQRSNIITVNYFAGDDYRPVQYGFSDDIKVNIYDDFMVNLKDLDL
jgi:Uma2 family endonuclease